MSLSQEKPESTVDAAATRRDLLKTLGKAAYIAPVTLALLSSKAGAASLV